MISPPPYFERIRQRSSERWDQLESDPELAAPWHQLFKQVQSPRHVLSELLQNADDAGATEAVVDLDQDVFTFAHNGEDFAEEHFASLCRFGYSNKRALHTIGFRGIGFKSTFSLGPRVHLTTPTLSVCFDRGRFTQPQWIPATGRGSLTEVRVPIADIHRRRELEKNLKEWLASPVSLLFFKNVRKIRISGTEIFWGDLGPGPVPESAWHALNNDPEQAFLLVRSKPQVFPHEALTEIRDERMIGVDQETEFPPSIVEIVLGAPGRLYVVLPTGVETALPFACNAPFIQDPARLKIKDPDISPTNRWLLGRVGALAADTMKAWLAQNGASVAERSRAYALLPDVDRDDPSLEGSCGTIAEEAFAEAIGDASILLSDAGTLLDKETCVRLPGLLSEIWTDAEPCKLFDDDGRAPFSSHVAEGDARKLVRWNYLDEISRDDVLGVLRNAHLPRPDSWRRLLKLWAYVAADIVGNRYYRRETALKIVPVQGHDVLYSAGEVVRLGEKRLLQSEEDWEFLARYLIVLNPNWPRFLAEQRRLAKEGEASEPPADIEAALAVLEALGLQDASDASKVLDQVASDFFAQDDPDTSACVQLAQIAAKLGAAAGPSFQFVTRDDYLRPADHVVLVDRDGNIEPLLNTEWSDSHLLHEAYGLQTRSCTREEWDRWIASGRSGLSTFVPLEQTRIDVWGKQKILDHLKQRGHSGGVNLPYVTSSFVIHDWNFAPEHWEHWTELAQDDPKIWCRIVENILLQPETYWSRAGSAKVYQIATTGSTRQITYEDMLPSWILRLRKLSCLPDTRGVPRRPSELLCRTPATEPVMDVELFIHGMLDREATRPLLELLGVGEVPTGPSRLLDYLRGFAASDNPPAHEVDKWYRRLDQMIDTCSTVEAAQIRDAFRNENIILTDEGIWSNAAGVFLLPEQGEIPGARKIRASVQELSLWRKVGVADYPTADLAIDWLKSLPPGQTLAADDARLVRSLLSRHATRIWEECGHWLNLAGEWVPVAAINYALSMQSLVAYSHLYEHIKRSTADLQRLSAEIAEAPPFKSIPRLAEAIEERYAKGLDPHSAAKKQTWLSQLGTELGRVNLDDETEQYRVRELGRALAGTRVQTVNSLELVPYIDGTPAGTPRAAEVLWRDQMLNVRDRPSARLARDIAAELGRAFGRPDIADAIKICFERPAPFISEYMEQYFSLADPELELESDEPLTPESTDTEDEAGGAAPSDPPATDEPDIISPAPDAAPDVPDIEEEEDLPPRERPQPKPPKPSLIERYARAKGFRHDGDGCYYHPDGRSIVRLSGDIFPWEIRTNTGEAECRYWFKDHCLALAPLEIDAEKWSLLEKAPESYAFVLADPEGNPVEWSGTQLRSLQAAGAINIYPASYRLVVDHDRK